MRKLLGPTALGLALGLSQTATAAEVTRVATAFEEDNPFDLHFGVSYQYDFKKAAILREWSDGQNTRLARDLIYRQKRQTVAASIEIGVYKDLAIYAALPIVVSDNRNYEFDQEGDCVFADDPGVGSGEATCVNKSNSTSIRDGIIPRDGFDALEPDDPYNSLDGEDTNLIFNSPTRRGLDQVHVGIKYGVTNQTKWSHLPNWVIGLEGRFAVGRPMTFSRHTYGPDGDPDANHRVGRGIHQIGVWTALSRRYRYLEPFFGAHWMYGMRAGNTELRSFSTDAQTVKNPMQEAGAYFGAEIVPWERKAKQQKVSIILSGSAVLKYNGQGYSEVWELLSDSPALAGVDDPGNQTCDVAGAIAGDPANDANDEDYLSDGGGDCRAFNGITTIQDYATFGARAALNFHLGKYARLNLGADMQTDTRHFLTAASRGQPDLAGDPDVVDPGTADVNPVRRDVVDSVGRRYAIDDVFQIVGFANFLLTF
jgi:hypothetical protein